MIASPDGELCSDFELVNRAPAELDLPVMGPRGIAAYNAAAELFELRKADERVLKALGALAMLQGVACLAMAPGLPMLLEGLKPMIEQWRETPFAGGLA
ncbi:hypothetical protein LCL61_04880 [Amycolatopsis coloradensis]|uniref:Uncharacterized protein n=1 Tax=Amycolatopsis coloradensis TaxID=76021 RepID=A0ACD5B690_9PSEU